MAAVAQVRTAREELVRRFGAGDLIANATLQPGLEALETSYGFWAYRRVRETCVTLGGPLCAPGDRGAMLDRLLATQRSPLLCYVREDLLASLDAGGAELRARGLYAAGMGCDHHLDVARLLARPGAEVQSAVRKAQRSGLALAPLDLAHAGPEARAKLAGISREFLARAEIGREMSFLNRPLTPEAAGERVAFWLTTRDHAPPGADGHTRVSSPPSPDRIFGVVVLNPIFDQGALTGYLLDVLRFQKTRLWGLWLAVVHALAARMHERGLGLSLGFCPLHDVSTPRHGASRVLSWQMRKLAELCGSARYLERLRTMKSLVPHTSEPRYFAGRSRSALVNLYAFTEAMGVGFGSLFGPDLVRVLRRGLAGEGARASAATGRA